MKPHKHAELIKAWADGAEIQFKHYEYKFCDGVWIDFATGYKPSWDEKIEYRIKPEPKPDRSVLMNFKPSKDFPMALVLDWCKEHEQPTLKLTFDGETGELKSAEVIR